MNLGFPEMIFLFLFALILFGPKKLPEIGRQIGKFMAEFKRASNEFKSQIESEISQLDIQQEREKQRELQQAREKEAEQKLLAPVEPPPGAIATLPPGSDAVPVAQPAAESASTDSPTAPDLNPTGKPINA